MVPLHTVLLAAALTLTERRRICAVRLLCRRNLDTVQTLEQLNHAFALHGFSLLFGLGLEFRARPNFKITFCELD